MPSKSVIENSNDIILHKANEVDQILGHPPSWILKYGMTLLLVAVFIFGIIAWLIKYPDVISAKVTITTETPSIKVIAQASGKINHWMVANNQIVEKGALIAILDSPANSEDILRLEQILDNIENNDLQAIDRFNNLNLGSIQSSYASLSQKINDYHYFVGRTVVSQKTNSLNKQILHIEQLNNNLKKQQLSLTAEVTLVNKNFLRSEQLHKDGLLSDVDFEIKETQLLQYNRQLENLENQIITNDINIEQLRTQIIDLKQNKEDGQSERQLNIKEDLERLKSEVALWKQRYVISAPIAGKTVLSKIWSEQQFVQSNEEVLTIVPPNGSRQIIGKAALPIANSGKVKEGQVANIRLDGFPFQEYGMIKSQVESISLIPVNQNPNTVERCYLVEIQLPDSLMTTYSKRIPFRQEMEGTANIITEDRRVLERIFDRINNILKNT